MKLTQSVGLPLLHTLSSPCPAPVLLFNLLQIFIFIRKQNGSLWLLLLAERLGYWPGLKVGRFSI